ncbi:MAG: SDR family NAD(P)-dependent oxidoreductase [Myxococcota bacterium]
MTEVSGNIAWITGASSGIGKALAQVFSENGAAIILSGRRVEALEAVARDLQTETLVLPFEATDYDKLASITAEAWDWKGRVGILINNAGVGQRSLAIDTDPQVYADLVNIDLVAPLWLTQLQLQRMAAVGGGHVVGISSVAGRIGTPMRTGYCAAKHGLIGYMDALRSEVSSLYNIRVTSFLPGSVATHVARNALTADGSKRGRSDTNIEAGTDPRDCAEAILAAVKENAPERFFAEGMELEYAKMRHADPDQYFALSVQIGAQIAATGVPDSQ